MSIIKTNGFKIKKYEEGRLDISLLIDGEEFTEVSFENVSPEEKENIIAKQLADEMYSLDIARGETQQERERIARKIMTLNIVNGYSINVKKVGEENNLNNICVDLLKNGETFASTVIREISNERVQEVKEKLNNSVYHNLDLKKQYRPLWFSEIFAIIK